MARRRRCFVEGYSWHVTQRGVDRGLIFRSSDDYEVFLAILTYECRRCDLQVHAYALMRNHLHLLATPQSRTSLPNAMKGLGRYIQFFNARYSRTGGLWEGRYKPALIHDQRYWLTCMRYVELNPVRAGIVERPEQYRWTSYAHNGLGRHDPLITEHPLYTELGTTRVSRALAWRRMCGQDLADPDLQQLRKSLQTGIVCSEPSPIEEEAV